MNSIIRRIGVAAGSTTLVAAALLAVHPATADAASWTMGSGYPTDQNYTWPDYTSNINKYYSNTISGSWDKPITYGVKNLPGGYSASTTLAPGSNTSTVDASVSFNIPMQPDGVYHPVVYATDGTTTRTTTWTLTIVHQEL